MTSWLTHLFQFGTRRPHGRLVIGAHGPWGLGRAWLDLSQFNSHLYVVGQSGQGKSKFLQHLLFQLTTTAWGCGVFDPHSDLASELLAQLATQPARRPWLAESRHRQRLIYVDPARTDYLLPCNLLKNRWSTPYETAENVVEAFRRVWPETLVEAPRFAQILRNALVVLIANGLTLLELEPLLTQRDFRQRLLQQVTDPLVGSFFTQQYDRWGREQAIFVAPVLNKISAFLFMPQVRLMLGADENWLDFRRILDAGQVLVLNLGGFRDEETQRLLGSLWLTSLEQAAFSRSEQAPAARRPFFCMVDEFPLFCARDPTSLARILSECRKYRLHLGLAHQTVGQLLNGRIQGALENAQLKVVFGTGRQTAEAIVKEIFLPDPKAVKHEVLDEQAKARTHPVFDPLLEQFEGFIQRIQRLRPRRALLKLPDDEPVKAVNIPKLAPAPLTPAQLEQVKQALAQQVGRPAQQLEQQIAARVQQQGVPLPLPHAARSSPRKPAPGQEFWQ